MSFKLFKGQAITKTIGNVTISIIAMNTMHRAKLSDLSRERGMEGVAKASEYILRALTDKVTIDGTAFEPFELSDSLNPHDVEHAKVMGAIVRAGMDAGFPTEDDVKKSEPLAQPISMEKAAESVPSES